MSQFLRPNADTALDSWTDDGGGATNIFQAIDEATRDDLDFIRSPNNPSSQTYEAALSSASTPDTGTRTVRYAYGKNGSGGRTIEVNVELREGTTRIHLWTHSDVADGFAAGSQTVSGGITDYGNLNLRAWGVTSGGGAGRRAQVSWGEFEIPDAPAGGVGMPLVMHHRKQMAGN